VTIIREDPDTGLQLYCEMRAPPGVAPMPIYKFRCVPPRALPAHLAGYDPGSLEAASATFDSIAKHLRDNPE
jgi:hypothetical protein